MAVVDERAIAVWTVTINLLHYRGVCSLGDFDMVVERYLQPEQVLPRPTRLLVRLPQRSLCSVKRAHEQT